jgi:uncharacterized protein
MSPVVAIGKHQRLRPQRASAPPFCRCLVNVHFFEHTIFRYSEYPWRLRFSAVAFFNMAITFDPEKNARNIAERGLSFERVAKLDWDTAVIVEDTRRNYGEPRLRVIARLDGRLHAAVVTPRGEDLRIISFRRASRREVRLYGKKDER